MISRPPTGRAARRQLAPILAGEVRAERHGARFKRPVVPGDQLILDVEITRVARSIWKYSGRASVEGQTTAEAELMCTLREIDPPAGRPTPSDGGVSGTGE